MADKSVVATYRTYAKTNIHWKMQEDLLKSCSSIVSFPLTAQRNLKLVMKIRDAYIQKNNAYPSNE